MPANAALSASVQKPVTPETNYMLHGQTLAVEEAGKYLGLKKKCYVSDFPTDWSKSAPTATFLALRKKKKSATDPVQRFRFLSKVKTISLREFVRADFRIFSVFNKNYDQEQQHGYCVVC